MKNRERKLKIARAQASLMSRSHPYISYIYEFSDKFIVASFITNEKLIEHTYKNGNEIANATK